MRAVAAEVAAEVFSALAAAVGALLFTTVGMITELSGLQSLQSGELAAGAWMAYMGAIALFVGVYLLGLRTFVPAAARLHVRIADWAS